MCNTDSNKINNIDVMTHVAWPTNNKLIDIDNAIRITERLRDECFEKGLYSMAYALELQLTYLIPKESEEDAEKQSSDMSPTC